MITRITDHKGDALKRLLQQYKGKANFESLFKPILDEYQTLEDATFQLLRVFDIDYVQGDVLDIIGIIVGIERGSGISDAIYRQLLRAKIAQNFSDGTPEVMIELLNILRGSAEARLREYFPAEVYVYIDDTVDADIEPYVEPIMQASAPAGVEVIAVEYPTTDPFIFRSIADDTSEGKGFSQVGTLTEGQLGKLL